MLKKILYAIGFHFGHGLRKAFKDEIDYLIQNKSFNLSTNHEFRQKQKSYEFFEKYIEKSFICKNRFDNL